MKVLGSLALILALAGAGVADARTTPPKGAHSKSLKAKRKPVRAGAIAKPAPPTTVSVVDRNGVTHRYSAGAWAQMQARSRRAPTELAVADETPAPGFGLVQQNGSRQTVVGVYKRPEGPNAYPDLYRPKGATAGVAVNMKLGGS